MREVRPVSVCRSSFLLCARWAVVGGASRPRLSRARVTREGRRRTSLSLASQQREFSLAKAHAASLLSVQARPSSTRDLCLHPQSTDARWHQREAHDTRCWGCWLPCPNQTASTPRRHMQRARTAEERAARQNNSRFATHRPNSANRSFALCHIAGRVSLRTRTWTSSVLEHPSTSRTRSARPSGLRVDPTDR